MHTGFAGRTSWALYLDGDTHLDNLLKLLEAIGVDNGLRASLYVRLGSLVYTAALYVSALFWFHIGARLQWAINCKELNLNQIDVYHDYADPLMDIAEILKESPYEFLEKDFMDGRFPEGQAFEEWDYFHRDLGDETLDERAQKKLFDIQEEEDVWLGQDGAPGLWNFVEPILKLLGEAIEGCLQHNCSDYIREGPYSKAKISMEDLAVGKMIHATGAPPERSFGMGRYFGHRNPLHNCTLAGLVLITMLGILKPNGACFNGEIPWDLVLLVCDMAFDDRHLTKEEQKADIVLVNDHMKRKLEESEEAQRQKEREDAEEVHRYWDVYLHTAVSSLDKAMRGMGLGEQRDFLKDQIRGRFRGCKFTYEDASIEDRVFSNLPSQEAIAKMLEMLKKMMKLERAPRTQRRYTKPEQPPIESRELGLSTIGPVTKRIHEHERQAEERAADLMDEVNQDDPELVGYQERFEGMYIYDHDERGHKTFRIIRVCYCDKTPGHIVECVLVDGEGAMLPRHKDRGDGVFSGMVPYVFTGPKARIGPSDIQDMNHAYIQWHLQQQDEEEEEDEDEDEDEEEEEEEDDEDDEEEGGGMDEDEEEDESPYERRRRENMKRNRAVLDHLGLGVSKKSRQEKSKRRGDQKRKGKGKGRHSGNSKGSGKSSRRSPRTQGHS